MKKTLIGILCAAAVLSILPLAARASQPKYRWFEVPEEWVVPAQEDGRYTHLYIVIPDGDYAAIDLRGASRLFESVQIRKNGQYGESIKLSEETEEIIYNVRGLRFKWKSYSIYSGGSEMKKLYDNYQGGTYGKEVFYFSAERSGVKDVVLLYRRGGKTRLQYQDGGKLYEHTLGEQSWTDFKTYITSQKVDKLCDSVGHYNREDGTTYTYVHLTAEEISSFRAYEPYSWTEHDQFAQMLAGALESLGYNPRW